MTGNILLCMLHMTEKQLEINVHCFSIVVPCRRRFCCHCVRKKQVLLISVASAMSGINESIDNRENKRKREVSTSKIEMPSYENASL